MRKMTIRNWNKKAYSDLADILMFVVVSVIIWLGIFAGFYIFYSFETDVRSEEAKIIGNRLINSVAENGFLREEVLLDDFDIYNEAGLDKSMFVNGGDYYFRLDVVEKEVVQSFSGGNLDFEVKCGLKTESGKNLPKCFKKEVNLGNFKIKVLTASNQLGSKL